MKLFFRCDSIEKLRNKIYQIEKELNNDVKKFKDLYHFTFTFGKNSTQKSLDLEDAIEYWKMILSDKFKYLNLWIDFLNVVKKKIFSKFNFLLIQRNITKKVYQKIHGIFCSNLL